MQKLRVRWPSAPTKINIPSKTFSEISPAEAQGRDFEMIVREIRRCTRVVEAFPDGNSTLLPVSARLRQVAHRFIQPKSNVRNLTGTTRHFPFEITVSSSFACGNSSSLGRRPGDKGGGGV